MNCPHMKSLRPELEPLPARMQALPVDERGYVVPWFVDWIDGKPEFRAMDVRKWVRAVKEKLCWVCGGRLGRYMTFVAGPMCGINRTSSEPPSHRECAQWSARNCPFLANSQAIRRVDEVIGADMSNAAGFALTRNPGVTMLWTTKDYSVFNDGKNKPLLHMGEPEHRKSQAAWKKSANESRELLVKELERWDVESMLISTNIPTKISGDLQIVNEPRDPGVALYFSRKLKEDYSWQDILGINDPAPTLDMIDRAYRDKARIHHPDTGGDIETFKMITAARDRARAWVNQRENQDHQYVIACDTFKEVRWNITAIRLTIAALRQMERCGTSSLLERAFKGFEAITEKSSAQTA